MPNVDQITSGKRRREFRQKSYIKTVVTKQEKGELNFLKRTMQLPKEMDAITKEYANHNAADIVLRQGLHINELTAELTDAYLDAICCGIKNFEAKPLQEKAKLWRESYSEIFDRMIRPHLKKHREALDAATSIDKFLSLPDSLFKARQGKKNITQRAQRKMKKYKETPRQNFFTAIDRVINRKISGLTSSGKAMRVCVAASVYADIMEQHGEKWRHSYRTAMRYAYIKLRNHPEIIKAIIGLK